MYLRLSGEKSGGFSVTNNLTSSITSDESVYNLELMVLKNVHGLGPFPYSSTS